jgi:hypothetical protein
MTVMMAQFGVEAAVRKNVMPRGCRSESGVANWTGEHSTKTQPAKYSQSEQSESGPGRHTSAI